MRLYMVTFDEDSGQYTLVMEFCPSILGKSSRSTGFLHVFTSSMPSLGWLVEWLGTNHGLYICPPGSTWPRQSFSTGAQRDVAKYGQGTDIQATATNARLAWTNLSRFLVSTSAIPGPWCWRLTHHDERRPGRPSIFGI